MADNWYLVWSNEHTAWWGPSNGYVRSLSQAGRYSRQQAIDIATRAMPGTANRLGMLPDLPVAAVDVAQMVTTFRESFPELPPQTWE